MICTPALTPARKQGHCLTVPERAGACTDSRSVALPKGSGLQICQSNKHIAPKSGQGRGREQGASWRVQVLRVLLKLLETSRESRTLAVGASDLGNFISAHPHGRSIVAGGELSCCMTASRSLQPVACCCARRLAS